ncbi:class III signal peptide-containing protein [Methanocaldococcus indicus]|uniref:class III signal peptide-containing protein n=1 Tax=Methanocaldococcus indicus TaxID=213231 RepID=UPI003C6DA9ED
MINKVYSERGQISMELAILILAAVVVSTIAAYFYIKEVRDTWKQVDESVNNVVSALNNKTMNITKKIQDNILK